MSSEAINYIILLFSVIVISLIQTRFKLITENPFLFILSLVLVPLMVFGKIKRIDNWDVVMYFLIAGYALMLAYGFNKHIVPKINEGFVLAYTLIFWYIEIDTIITVGLNFWTIVIPMIAIYPTYLVLRASFEDRLLSVIEKRIMIIWFYFMVVYIYIDQIILSQTICLIHYENVDFASTFMIILTAIKLYFISCLGCMIFISIPIFHLDRSSRKFSDRWNEAMSDWKEVMDNAASNYIDYQITPVQSFYIILFTICLFVIDKFVGIRYGIIEIYITIIPIIIFYIKLDVTKLNEIE